MSDEMPAPIKPFADAERFVLEGDEGQEQTWVVLAISEVGSKEYALLAPEQDLVGGDGDMEVCVFEYRRGGEHGTELGDIEDETQYERVYRHLADLMGLEDAQDN